MAIAGYGGGVYIDTTKVAEIATGAWICRQTTRYYKHDSDGWRENQGIKEWSGSFEGNFAPEDTRGRPAD